MGQVVSFQEDGHEYTVDGAAKDSVTHITRFISREKQDAAPSLQRESAADRGRRAHEYCQLYDYDSLPDQIDSDCAGYVEAYKKFCRDYRVEWLHSELILYSPGMDICGTIDRVGIIDGSLSIVDLKCTAALDRRSGSAQLGGYDQLYFDNFGERAKKLWLLRLKKDGTYQKPYQAHKPEQAFQHCLWMHRYMKEDFDA